MHSREVKEQFFSAGLWFQQVMLFEMERMRPSFLFIRFKEY